MEKQTKPAPRLVVLFNPWTRGEHDYGDSTNYRFHILHVDPKDEKPRNCSRSGAWEAPGTEIFDDLELSVYISWFNGQFSANSFSVRYHGYMFVDMADAENMLKGLKKASKVWKAFPIQPQSFGQFVVLMAGGFGVKECCRVRHDGHTGMYTDSEWQYLPLSYIQHWIDEEIDKLRKSFCPQATEAA